MASKKNRKNRRASTIDCDQRYVDEPAMELSDHINPDTLENSGSIHSAPETCEQYPKPASQTLSYMAAENTSVRWTYGTFRLQAWSRIQTGENSVPVKSWLAFFFDVGSLSVPGLSLSIKAPQPLEFLHTLRIAILPKKNARWLNRGLPDLIEVEPAHEYPLQDIAEILAKLNVKLEYVSPFYPLKKSKRERLIVELERFLSKTLPAHSFGTFESAQKNVDTLLNADQLLEVIERFLVDNYHEQIRPQTGRKPSELWAESTIPRMPEEDSFMVLQRFRTVSSRGIKLSFQGVPIWYWTPALANLKFKKVKITFDPENLSTVKVYSIETGEFFCEAMKVNGKDSCMQEDGNSNRRGDFHRRLRDRSKTYKEVSEHEDRPVQDMA